MSVSLANTYSHKDVLPDRRENEWKMMCHTTRVTQPRQILAKFTLLQVRNE